MTKDELKVKNRLYYLKNREKRIAQQKERSKSLDKDKEAARFKEYYNTHKEQVIKRTRRNSIRWFAENFHKKMWYTARARAKRSGIDFDITPDDIVIPTCCPYLGILITTTQNEGRVVSNASLDRIDNTKGYIKGNVQVISDLANRMKQDASIETLIKFAEGVLKTHAGRAIDNQTSTVT